MKTLLLTLLLTLILAAGPVANSLELSADNAEQPNYDITDCSADAKMYRAEFAARSLLPVLRFAQPGLQLNRVFKNEEKDYENYIFNSGYVSVVVQFYIDNTPGFVSCLLSDVRINSKLGANEPEVQSESENFYCGRLKGDHVKYSDQAPLYSIVSRKMGGSTVNYVKIFNSDGQTTYEELVMKLPKLNSSLQESANYQYRITRLVEDTQRTLISKSDVKLSSNCVK